MIRTVVSPRTRRCCSTILLSIVGLCAAGAASAERRVALVIGNSDYAKAPLENPRNDASDVASLLREQLGFDTTLHFDLDQRAMERALQTFGDAARDADVRLFYYAGHGVSVDGANYLIPVAAEIDNADEVEFEALDSARVLAKMEAADGGANVMILDACRDNPLPRATRSASSSGLAKMDAPLGSLILYATAPGDVALDGDGRNGTFTKHLLNSLAAPGVHLGDVAIDVRVAVMQETRNRQVPWSESSLTRRVYLAAPPELVAEAATSNAVTPDEPSGTGDQPIEPQPADSASTSTSDYAADITIAYVDAAESGDSVAQSRLGYLLDTGHLFAEDDRAAKRWYERAVAQGDLAAHVNLGAMLLAGEVVDRDPQRARTLFEIAADAGYAAAETNLGMLYQFGESVPLDYERAKAWYERAAAGGDAEAAASLGDLYSYGLGVEADLVRARAWYLEAAKRGSAAAQSELGYLYEQGEGGERDYDEAFLWFSRSAAQAFPRGEYNLGEMYEYGKGVAADLDRAVELYRRAARRGDTEARSALARLGR